MADGICNVYLNLAQKCNLSCSYCYADGGGFGREERLMEQRTMERALERLVPHGGSLVVSFFGGEPLLNFHLLRSAVEYGDRLARERGAEVRYALTTNGTVMSDEMLAFLKAHIAHVAVSLDGVAAVTDRQRRFRNGGRSVHDAVRETLGRLREAGIRFGLRGTVTESAAGEVATTARYLAGLGSESVRLAPAFSAMGWDERPFDTLVEALGELEVDALRQFAAGAVPVTGEHLFKVVPRVFGGEPRRYPCSAGREVVAVAADGGVYPCDHFIGHEAFLMGNVHDTEWPGARFHAVRRRMEENDTGRRGNCGRCGVNDICGGECPAQSLLVSGEIRHPSAQHCALMHRLSERLLREIGTLTVDPAAERRLRQSFTPAG
jgi:uncharacterized protein